ncbi:hypothetical protein IWX90DRAFT_274210 [Phyllosticta citrichinensis]|uniref:Uncharacterized protein n=1 Tax=Phyllosticta citrichinensis TaxID=1130410 RepID=A0ABR1XN42_9PEZI
MRPTFDAVRSGYLARVRWVLCAGSSVGFELLFCCSSVLLALSLSRDCEASLALAWVATVFKTRALDQPTSIFAAHISASCDTDRPQTSSKMPAASSSALHHAHNHPTDKTGSKGKAAILKTTTTTTTTTPQPQRLKVNSHAGIPKIQTPQHSSFPPLPLPQIPTLLPRSSMSSCVGCREANRQADGHRLR